MIKKALESVLEVRNLVKKFDDFVAVDDISFKVEKGQVLGLLGPNGAGKSTTIFCILGLIEKDSGEVKIFGKDFASHRSEILEVVNYASNESQLPWNLTVFENLYVYGQLYTISNIKERIGELLEIFEISNLKKKLVRDISTGQRARLSLAKAFLNKPKLLLLDEPMASMDPDVVDKGISLIKRILKEEKMGILYTSHNMWEVEEITNEIVFINHGKIVARGSAIDLTRKVLKGAREPNLREVFIHISRQNS